MKADDTKKLKKVFVGMRRKRLTFSTPPSYLRIFEGGREADMGKQYSRRNMPPRCFRETEVLKWEIAICIPVSLSLSPYSLPTAIYESEAKPCFVGSIS